MKTNTILLITLCFASLSHAYDVDEAKEMYSEDCTKCHDSKVFTRKDTKVKNLAALKKQVHVVEFWEASSFSNDYLSSFS